MNTKQTGEDSIVTLVSRLASDAQTYVKAEVRLYQANIASRLADARTGIILGAVSMVLAFSALMTLLVGLVLVLLPLIGPLGATAVVVIGTLAVAGVCGWLAIGKIKAATASKDDPAT